MGEAAIQVQDAVIDWPKAEGPTSTFSNIQQIKKEIAFTEELHMHNEMW